MCDLASERFSELIKEVGATLRGEGFSRIRNRFFVRAGENSGLLDFQKSQASTRDEVRFTLNLGVHSGRLSRFFSNASPAKKPSIWDCHWRVRVGELMPGRTDKWWRIGSGEPIDGLEAELRDAIELAVPHLEQHLSDAQLCELWLSGRSPGLTELQRLMHLSVLLKAAGSQDTLEKVVKNMRDRYAGSACELTVSLHLRKLADYPAPI